MNIFKKIPAKFLLLLSKKITNLPPPPPVSVKVLAAQNGLIITSQSNKSIKIHEN
jgi:hypothetical protein